MLDSKLKEVIKTIKRNIELEKQAREIYLENGEGDQSLICSGKIIAYKRTLTILGVSSLEVYSNEKN